MMEKIVLRCKADRLKKQLTELSNNWKDLPELWDELREIVSQAERIMDSALKSTLPEQELLFDLEERPEVSQYLLEHYGRNAFKSGTKA